MSVSALLKKKIIIVLMYNMLKVMSPEVIHSQEKSITELLRAVREQSDQLNDQRLQINSLEKKITGPICAARGYATDKDRVTRLDVASVRDLLSKQRREVETLKLVVDVDGNLVNEMKLLRKESRNMNSRVTQLYMQLLHEIIRKRDNSLELAQLETRVLNATAESLRLSSRYRELETRFSALSAVVNNQSVLIAALEERCMQVYGRRRDHHPEGPPLVQVVPENLPVSVPRFTNEIQRDNGREAPRERGSRSGPSPTGSTMEAQKPPAGNFSVEGPYRDCLHAQEAGHTGSGVYLIRPEEASRPLQVWCEQGMDNGGWTVIQSRRDGSVNFFRNWDSYKVRMHRAPLGGVLACFSPPPLSFSSSPPLLPPPPPPPSASLPLLPLPSSSCHPLSSPLSFTLRLPILSLLPPPSPSPSPPPPSLCLPPHPHSACDPFLSKQPGCCCYMDLEIQKCVCVLRVRGHLVRSVVEDLVPLRGPD
uniref:Angiopoietin-related protein 3-like n=1 Tax=Gadus morhua TaxID=8049 RepID=A0A8C5A359_GADMO